MTEKQTNHRAGKETTKGGRSRVTINALPDVALLKIFDFYVDEEQIETWCTLVHVCRKWRNVAFGSPRRLNLQLYCTAGTPVKETLDVWPRLPIVIRVSFQEMWGVDNIIAALGHNDRVCIIDLFGIPSSQFETVSPAMQQPFPALTHLQLWPRGETASVVPALFLGGPAPRLQTLILNCISFPGLPKLLLTATHLVHLELLKIPHSGYFSPEAMATCLFALANLQILDVRFESPRSCPDRKNQLHPPSTRVLLPVLTKLRFKGVCEYLEDLMARIDTPLLDNLWITFFNQLIIDTPQLTHFISRTPKFKAHNEAHVSFSDRGVSVTFPRTSDGRLYLEILCRQSDWQLSSLTRVYSSSLPQALTNTVEYFYIKSGLSLHWEDDVEGSQWLELFHPLKAVKDLYISPEFVPFIALALQELVGERVTEVLPELRTIFFEESLLSGPLQETIGQFVAARQHSSHPIAVSLWQRWY